MHYDAGYDARSEASIEGPPRGILKQRRNYFVNNKRGIEVKILLELLWVMELLPKLLLMKL